MIFEIITAFPEAFSYFNESIIKRAKNNGVITINIHNLRDFTNDSRKTIDDRPYGGNPGMLIKVDPVYKALKYIGVYPARPKKTKVILTSAKGNKWTQKKAIEYKENLERIVIICGHYEGFDHRIEENLIDEEISLGEFILSGGEIASMALVDTITRLMPGVLGNSESLEDESFNTNGFIEYPQYTRPETFKTDEGKVWGIPEVLKSGNHKEIESWKKENTNLKK